MKIEPGTFFIGIVDFFSIILPGAVITYLAKNDLQVFLTGRVLPRSMEPSEGWAVFLFVSYLLGHFIFLIGSRLDTTYDRIRRATKSSEEKRVKKGKKPSSKFVKYLAKKMFPEDAELTVQEVLKIKARYLLETDGQIILNAFQWTKARLMFDCPAALSEVQRFEADSKFFRSMVVVLPITAIWMVGKTVSKLMDHDPESARASVLVALVSTGLSCLSFWCYVNRRHKSTEQAYRYLITLETCPKMVLHTKADEVAAKGAL